MGFAILLGLIAYFFLARAVARAVEKKTRSKKAKYITIAIFVLIPTWDIIPGWLYFTYMCKSEAGIKIYKTVEVDETKFLANGEPDEQELKDRFSGPMKFDDGFSRLFHITKSEGFVQDKQNGETLGAAVKFAYYGGWISAFLFPEGPPTVCPGITTYSNLWREVIKPKQGIKEGGN